MKLVLHNLVLRPHEKETALLKVCEKKLRAPCKYFKILKKSLDARDKTNIKWVYSVECSAREEPASVRTYQQISKRQPKVVVVGAGPAGLFCALRLLAHGIKPILVERGKRVEDRERDVRLFREKGILDPASNIQ
ncbi:MAG: FAD-dependent monooxygenase, partial [Clostridia bacterium]|nr:FAD-dependent monooxygenase [Clostridia bacterium]